MFNNISLNNSAFNDFGSEQTNYFSYTTQSNSNTFGQNEISQMLNKYCEIEITIEQKNKIRNDCLIQTLNIKTLIAKYLLEKNYSICSDDIDNIINLINNL
jgi:hypothetical protein